MNKTGIRFQAEKLRRARAAWQVASEAANAKTEELTSALDAEETAAEELMEAQRAFAEWKTNNGLHETEMSKLRQSPEDLVEEKENQLHTISTEIDRLQALLETATDELERGAIRTKLRTEVEREYQAQLASDRALRASYGEG